MGKLRDNKGFTLVELLAVIVVLAIVMGLAVVGISSVLENTRKSAFAADAKSFLAGAKSLVDSDQANAMLGLTTSYSPRCTGATGQTVYLPLSLIPLNSGGVKSPYGTNYVKATGTKTETVPGSGSYVAITSTIDGGNCTFSYGIYLEDETMKMQGAAASGSNPVTGMGTGNKALMEDYIDGSRVVKKTT